MCRESLSLGGKNSSDPIRIFITNAHGKQPIMIRLLNHCYYDCLEKIVIKLKWNSNDNVFHLETKYKYEDQNKYIHLIFADSDIKHCSGKIYKLATFV